MNDLQSRNDLFEIETEKLKEAHNLLQNQHNDGENSKIENEASKFILFMLL
jgi:predicted metal-dependent hydrolase